MKFQSLETRVALVTVLTSLLLVTPSSADYSCRSWSVDFDVVHGSGCRKISEDAPNFPSDLRSLSLEGGEPGDAARLDHWDFAGLTGLESLSLSRMVISEIRPCALCSLSALRGVVLDNVTLERLPPDLLVGSSDLREFSATGCSLTDVPQELFAENPAIRKVDLSGNALTVVPRGLFLGRTRLSWVDLSDNQLTFLPLGIFATNGNLQHVSLAGNRLTSMPLGMFDGMPPLEVLWMTSILEGVLGIDREYPALTLDGNPLRCDCHLQSDFFKMETQLGWTVSLPGGCGDEMFRPDCPLPVRCSSSSSPVVVVTRSLYLGVVGWTIWWQVAKGLLDT